MLNKNSLPPLLLPECINFLNRKRFLVLLLLHLGGSAIVFSQTDRVYRKYATQQVMNRLQKDQPTMKARQDSLEHYIESFKIKGATKRVTIPVVFHILKSPDQPEITEEQILAQIEMLNQDFSGDSLAAAMKQRSFGKAGFDKKVAKTEIDFCLAAGRQGFNPITTTPVAIKEWQTDDAMKSKSKGGSDAWDSKNYLNIWIGTLADGFCGYAQMPGGPISTDGIAIDYRYFGIRKGDTSPYSLGKTLTHLTGSYLGLYDLWNTYKYCEDDLVDDTPIHNAPNYGMPVYKHISLCPGYPVEMTMNFMDNTDDAGVSVFTPGQKIRIQAVLSKDGPRGMLGDAQTKCSKKDSEQFTFKRSENAANTFSEVSELLIHVSPNPADVLVQVDFKARDALAEIRLTVQNTIGSVVFQQTLQGNDNVKIECGSWPAGVYLIQARDPMGNQITKRLVISKKN
jgi:Pregnancy-associated plasma protein-A/Secretion system C-terminal sorting domain